MRGLLICFCMVLLMGCGQSNDVAEKIRQLESAPVTLQFEKMSCCLNDTLVESRPWESSSKLKLVVYVDSQTCLSCYLNSMLTWGKYTDLEKQYKDFYVYFILDIDKGMVEMAKEKLLHSGFHHPVYFDTEHTLRSKNPHIPNERFYHVFLLDAENDVILVGSPGTNSRMQNLFYDTLKSRSETTGQKSQN